MILPPRQNSLTEESFGEVEDLERKTLKEEKELKKPHRGVSGRSEGRQSPSETEKLRLVPPRGKRDLAISPRDGLGDEASYEIEHLRRECIKVTREKHRLSSMVLDLDSDNEHLQFLLEKQESQIRIMQEQNLKLIEANRDFLRAEDDETIRRKIQSSMRSLRSWATSYALPHRRNIKQTDEEITGEFFRSNVTARKFTKADEIFPPQFDAVAPGIILNTLLAKFVIEWIVRRPFCRLGGAFTSRDDLANEAAQVSQAFHLVYQKAQLHGKIYSTCLKSD